MDRSEASTAMFFDFRGPARRKGIRRAVMDMWKAFRNATTTHAPRAAIRYDKFHVLRQLNDAMDLVRNAEYKRRTNRADRSYINGQKYVLLSHRANLSPTKRQSKTRLLEREQTVRHDRRLTRLLQLARLRYTCACIRGCELPHPDVVTPSEVDVDFRKSLARTAVACEFTTRDPAATVITELLVARGADVQRELDAELLGWWPMQEGGADRVRWMLDRGANPHWTPPNGISVLEHALVPFRDPACVNLIAAHVTPKPALWIAAGLGDVAMLRQFVAARGRLTPAGRRNRSDLIAMGVVFGGIPLRQDADDLEIMWEAFRIAGWNQG